MYSLIRLAAFGSAIAACSRRSPGCGYRPAPSARYSGGRDASHVLVAPASTYSSIASTSNGHWITSLNSPAFSNRRSARSARDQRRRDARPREVTCRCSPGRQTPPAPPRRSLHESRCALRPRPVRGVDVAVGFEEVMTRSLTDLFQRVKSTGKVNALKDTSMVRKFPQTARAQEHRDPPRVRAVTGDQRVRRLPGDLLRIRPVDQHRGRAPHHPDQPRASSSQLTWVLDALVVPMAAVILVSARSPDLFGAADCSSVASRSSEPARSWGCSRTLRSACCGRECGDRDRPGMLLPSSLAVISNAIRDPHRRGPAIGAWRRRSASVLPPVRG